MVAKSSLDSIYRKYNRREFVHPDPLEFLYRYDRVEDRETVGLIAACLAYGRVNQILRSVDFVLSRMGKYPRDYVVEASASKLRSSFSGFKHRFATGEHFVSLLLGMRGVLDRFGSLNNAFASFLRDSDVTVMPALKMFVQELCCMDCHLVPDPSRGSACKRLNLYLRWMVRQDSVDPGGWSGVSMSKLIVPLDTHMAKIGVLLGFTSRRSPGLQMALDITHGFRRITPRDPVKYDFALTRYGIREDMDMIKLTEKIGS